MKRFCRTPLAGTGFSQEELDLDGPQRRLKAFSCRRSVPCLNLLPAFRAVPDTYAPFDTHWNVAGNHLAAREIAAWLPTQGFNTELNCKPRTAAAYRVP